MLLLRTSSFDESMYLILTSGVKPDSSCSPFIVVRLNLQMALGFGGFAFILRLLSEIKKRKGKIMNSVHAMLFLTFRLVTSSTI